MTPRQLSEAEYRSTFGPVMLEIKGNEPVIQTAGVIDVAPYLALVRPSDMEGLSLLPDRPPAAVYRSGDARYDHVLYPLNRSNVYLVLVIELKPDHILGHYVLDLAKEFGLGVRPDTESEAS